MKKCPFCGCEKPINNKRKKNKIHPVTGQIIMTYYSVWCSGCGAYGPDGDTRKEAAKLWNRRKI